MGFLLCGLPVFWNMAVMEQKWLEKRNALGTQEEYAGTIFLAICIFLLFIGWQNFYVENSLTRALAKELAPCGIAVNALSCGMIDTPMNGCFSPEEVAAICEEIPAGRMGTPEEIAEMAALLAEAPVYLTGQVIAVDGGWQ